MGSRRAWNWRRWMCHCELIYQAQYFIQSALLNVLPTLRDRRLNRKLNLVFYSWTGSLYLFRLKTNEAIRSIVVSLITWYWDWYWWRTLVGSLQPVSQTGCYVNRSKNSIIIICHSCAAFKRVANVNEANYMSQCKVLPVKLSKILEF